MERINLRVWVRKPNSSHELVLGKSGPFPSPFLSCAGFSIFPRILTTTWWEPPRYVEGLPDSLGFSWSAESPTGLTTAWLKIVLEFSIFECRCFHMNMAVKDLSLV